MASDEDSSSSSEEGEEEDLTTTTGEGGTGTAATEDEDETDYRKMEPERVFATFDTDGSGMISLDEFTRMLPKLGIKISAAKAQKYFKLCDTDGSGEIDVDEFKVALFACDPTTGNSTGFAPNSLLTPLDAFEMFDEDGSGEIDEDEFAFVLEYLELNVADEKQEKLFSRYDKDGTGSISYAEFKQVWLGVVDVRKELGDRGVDVPKFATKRQLQRLLEKAVDDEEEAEKRALAQADQWRQWRAILDQKNAHIKRARLRAQRELSRALDCAGQVYVFGQGDAGQFNAPARLVVEPGQDDDAGTTKKTKKKTKGQQYPRVEGRALLDALWTRRVTAGAADLGGENPVVKNKNSVDDPGAIDVEELRMELGASAFRGLGVAENTAVLWGARISQVAVTDTVALALSDLGDLWTWGGNDRWCYDGCTNDDVDNWQGSTTPRSRILLGNAADDDDENPEDDESDDDDDLIDDDDDDDDEAAATKKKKKKTTKLEDPPEEKLRLVVAYFDAWKPAPSDVDRAKFYAEVLLPTIHYADLSLSLEVRGKTGERTKREMADALYRDFKLEKRVLGERAHRRIRELEAEIKELLKRRRGALARRLKLDIQKMWAPLLEMQAEEEAAERARRQTAVVEELAAREKRYERWRKDVEKSRRTQRPEYTPRGNSLVLETSGATARGPKRKLPRGYQAATAVAGGAHHFAVVHQSGALYTWGVGHSGRLGLDLTQNGNPRADAPRPTLVQALASTPVVQVACGRAHTACVSAARDLYVWGSAASGKLGLGGPAGRAFRPEEEDEEDLLESQEEEARAVEECYSSMPIAVPLRAGGSASRKFAVRNVSCGAAHTAATTVDGKLFVWGCGDGGRLGLGDFETRWTPALVSAFADWDIVIADVACGNAHTLAVSAVAEVSSDVKRFEGGRVYVAGSTAVLGERYGSCEFVCASCEPPLESVAVTQVAAGFGHSAAVTSEGELYLWGLNDGGCCGQPVTPKTAFLSEPTLAKAIYATPGNLAFGKPAKQSSCYGGLDAHVAVDGNRDGSAAKYCASTQQDPQAWWQVDLLSDDAVVTGVTVWNRCDEPADQSQPRDKYSSRLVPSWLMLAQKPFDERVGDDSLVNALSNSVAKHRLSKNQRCTTWRVPENTTARYVRLQLEGFDFLHVAQVEVFGYANGRAQNGVGRCGFVACGRKCTVAVVRPSPDQRAVQLAYKRAVRADARNADILRQFETYVLEYDKFGRDGVDPSDPSEPCVNCNGGGRLCEVCAMRLEFKSDLQNLPLGTAGRSLTLDETASLLLTAPKPKLNYTPPDKVDNSFAAKLKRRLQGSSGKDTTDASPASATTSGGDAPPSSGGDVDVVVNKSKDDLEENAASEEITASKETRRARRRRRKPRVTPIAEEAEGE